MENRYPIVLIPAEEGGYIALIKELPGCTTQGETVEEAIAMIEDAKQQWIDTALEYGDSIPGPDIDSLLRDRQITLQDVENFLSTNESELGLLLEQTRAQIEKLRDSPAYQEVINLNPDLELCEDALIFISDILYVITPVN